MTVWDRIRDYHHEHGDDYGSEEAREAKLRVILNAVPTWDHKTVLDVGCGTRALESRLPGSAVYTGIDLLDGQNVLDWTEPHDIVVANGVLYKLESSSRAFELIEYTWEHLAREALIVTSLSAWGGEREGELVFEPQVLWRHCSYLTRKLALRHDYLPGDFTIALYRE